MQPFYAPKTKMGNVHESWRLDSRSAVVCYSPFPRSSTNKLASSFCATVIAHRVAGGHGLLFISGDGDRH